MVDSIYFTFTENKLGHYLLKIKPDHSLKLLMKHFALHFSLMYCNLIYWNSVWLSLLYCAQVLPSVEHHGYTSILIYSSNFLHCFLSSLIQFDLVQTSQFWTCNLHRAVLRLLFLSYLNILSSILHRNFSYNAKSTSILS